MDWWTKILNPVGQVVALLESGIRVVTDQLYPDLDSTDVVMVVNFNYSSEIVDMEAAAPGLKEGLQPWRGLLGYDTA